MAALNFTRPANDGPVAMSVHHRTVQQRLVALNAADPQLVRAGPVEVALDPVGGDVIVADPLPPAPASNSLQAGASYQHLDLAVTDHDPATQRKFGVDPERPLDPWAVRWISGIRSVSIAW
ncbi:MAG: hypothetical protein WA962_02480 [Ornithinimicrobium sp.]